MTFYFTNLTYFSQFQVYICISCNFYFLTFLHNSDFISHDYEIISLFYYFFYYYLLFSLKFKFITIQTLFLAIAILILTSQNFKFITIMTISCSCEFIYCELTPCNCDFFHNCEFITITIWQFSISQFLLFSQNSKFTILTLFLATAIMYLAILS